MTVVMTGSDGSFASLTGITSVESVALVSDEGGGTGDEVRACKHESST